MAEGPKQGLLFDSKRRDPHGKGLPNVSSFETQSPKP